MFKVLLKADLFHWCWEHGIGTTVMKRHVEVLLYG
jgi:hypothetical protein